VHLGHPCRFAANSAGTSTITVGAVNGFANIINLVSNSTACTISPISITGSGSATLSCIFSLGQKLDVQVTGTNGTLVHTADVVYTVQDFTVTPSPASVTVKAGIAGTSTISVTSIQGFSGTVSMTYTVSLSIGLGCTLSPTSVNLGASGTSTLSCSDSAGSYTVTVTGTSGSLFRSTNVTYTIQDFTVTASPTSVNVNVNAPSTSTITITGLNGFAGGVSLGTNSTSCSISPNSVTGSGTATISCTFGSAGTFLVVVTGTNASLSHSATVTFTISDFSIAPSSLSLSHTVNSSTNSTLTLAGIDGFSGNVTFTATLTQESVQSSGSLVGGGGHSLQMTPLPAMPVISFSPTNVTLGTGSVSVIMIISSPYGVVAGTYAGLVTATSGTISHSISITLVVTDFSLSSNPSTLSVLPGGSANSTISVGSLGGFEGNVTLAVTVSPMGPNATLNSTSLTLTRGETVAALLVVAIPDSIPNGNYTITIIASSGSLSYSQTVLLVVKNSQSTNLLRLVTSQDSAPMIFLGLFSLTALSIKVTTKTKPRHRKSRAIGDKREGRPSPQRNYNLQFPGIGVGRMSRQESTPGYPQPFD